MSRRAANPAAATLSSAQLIVETLCRHTYEVFVEHFAWQYDKSALTLAIRMFAEEPPKRAKRDDLVAALKACWEKVNYHLLPPPKVAPAAHPAGYQHPALPSYRPEQRNSLAISRGAPQGDCKLYGMTGGCWGQCELYEVRNMLMPGGRCLESRCMGHRGIRYEPSNLPEDAGPGEVGRLR